MNARLDVLSAAALLHDIGRRYETREQGKICHAEKGAELARDILEELDFTPSFIDDIAHCIEAHRYRGDKIPRTLEAKILWDVVLRICGVQDADRVAVPQSVDRVD